MAAILKMAATDMVNQYLSLNSVARDAHSFHILSNEYFLTCFGIFLTPILKKKFKIQEGHHFKNGRPYIYCNLKFYLCSMTMNAKFTYLRHINFLTGIIC